MWRVRDDDEPREAPPVVVGAVSAGVAPLPFLLVYAVLFIAHGSVHPVVPPDITTTRHGELVAGLIALGMLIVGILSVVWLISGRRRWLFVLDQAGTLGVCIYLIVDRTTGSALLPVLLALASATALVLAVLPSSGRYVARPTRRLFARARST